jgi:hypothetical protein
VFARHNDKKNRGRTREVFVRPDYKRLDFCLFLVFPLLYFIITPSHLPFLFLFSTGCYISLPDYCLSASGPNSTVFSRVEEHLLRHRTRVGPVVS